MGCRSCGERGPRRTVHEVRNTDGTVRRYATEVEARAAATASGGVYAPIRE